MSAVLKPGPDDIRRAHNMRIGRSLCEAGIPVFVTYDKQPVVPRWQHLGDTMTFEERDKVRAERAKRRETTPSVIGSTLDPQRWVRMQRLVRRDGTASICCGLAGIVVIDADIKRDKKTGEVLKRGPELFEGFMAANGGMPDGVIVLTSHSGGKHYVFADPERKYGNGEGGLSDLGCNVRGRGGQIVAPGSWRLDGKRYGTLDDLTALIDAIMLDTLPALPRSIADLIGTASGATLNDNDSKFTEAMNALHAEDWPDYEETFGAGGRYDLDNIKECSPEFAELMDAPDSDRSDNRIKAASRLKGFDSRLNVRDFATFCTEHSDMCGEYVDGNEGPGTFSDRNIVRDFLRANAAETARSGNAMGNVADIDAADEREQAEQKAAKLDGRIAYLESDLEAAESDVALDVEGAESRVAMLRAMLKDAEKQAAEARRNANVRAKVKTRFIRASDCDQYQVPDDLIEDLVPAIGTTILVGNSNVGKTFLALEMLRCFATGDMFLGRNVDPCGALLATGEGFAGLQKRLRAIRKEWPSADLMVHTDVPAFGERPAEAVRKLNDMIDAYEEAAGKPLRFLALDNLLLMTGGADTNKAEVASPILKALNDLAKKRSISIAVIAHENRAGREAGSFAFRALADQLLHLKEGKTRVCHLSTGKARDGDKEPVLKFRLRVVDGLGVNKWGKPVTSCVVEHVPDGGSTGAAFGDVPDDTMDDAAPASTDRLTALQDRAQEADRVKLRDAVAAIVKDVALPDADGVRTLDLLRVENKVRGLREIKGRGISHYSRNLRNDLFGGETRDNCPHGVLAIVTARGRVGGTYFMLTPHPD